MVGNSLLPADLTMFERFGIGQELIAAHRIRRVTDAEARDLLGCRRHPGDLSGILFPGIHPETGQIRDYRVRRDHPEIENGRVSGKYMSSLDAAALYFPSGCS